MYTWLFLLLNSIMFVFSASMLFDANYASRWDVMEGYIRLTGVCLFISLFNIAYILRTNKIVFLPKTKEQ